LDDALIRKILDLQTDLVCVSLGGATAETHEYHRSGSDFEKLTCSLLSINDIKKSSSSDKPQVLLLYMMIKENMEELPLSIEFAAKVGAYGVVAINLDYVAVPLYSELKVFSCDKADEAFAEPIGEAEERARDKGVSFHAFPLEMKPVPVCSAHEDKLYKQLDEISVKRDIMIKALIRMIIILESLNNALVKSKSLEG